MGFSWFKLALGIKKRLLSSICFALMCIIHLLPRPLLVSHQILKCILCCNSFCWRIDSKEFEPSEVCNVTRDDLPTAYCASLGGSTAQGPCQVSTWPLCSNAGVTGTKNLILPSDKPGASSHESCFSWPTGSVLTFVPPLVICERGGRWGDGGWTSQNKHCVNFGAIKRLLDTLTTTDGNVSLQCTRTLEVPAEL